MTIIPRHVDILRRVQSGELFDGSDDYTTFTTLRALRGRGLIAHVGDGRPRWIVTRAGAAWLARRDEYEQRRMERTFGRATFAPG